MSTRNTRDDDQDAADAVATVPRAHFIAELFDYRAGQHVTIVCPSGGGKTHLGLELLAPTATPKMPAAVAVMKPEDDTIRRFAAKNGYRTIRDWPPPPSYQKVAGFQMRKPPPGWVLWPKETGDIAADEAHHHAVFARMLAENYRAKGARIVFADEVYSLEKELGLSKELVRIWTKGRSVQTGLWAASQRPAFISRWAYQAHHLFLGFDPDADTQKRFSEIGAGVESNIVRLVVKRLKVHQWLYINRDDRTMIVVDKS